MTRRRAFSLIELLVVVAVIAIVVAIMVPVLGRARAEGRASVCAGTLYQTGIAVGMYLDDNEGSFWPYFVDVVGPVGNGRQWWFGYEADGPSYNPFETHRPLRRGGGFLAPYLTGTQQDFRCPSFPYDTGRYFPKFATPAGGYGYNTMGLGGQNWLNPFSVRPRQAQQLDGRTSDIFVLADGLHFDRLDHSTTPPLAQTFNEPAFLQWQSPERYHTNSGVNGGFGHFRHNGRATVLYVDGHVAAQPPRDKRHPFSKQGFGPVANLTHHTSAVDVVQLGSATFHVPAIYGAK